MEEENKRELVPVNELDLARDRFAMSLSIPDYVEGGLVCIDTVALKAAMDFARVKTLKIIHENDEDDIQVGGVSGDGTATSAGVKSVQKPVDVKRFCATSGLKPSGSIHDLHSSSFWSNCTINRDLDATRKDIENLRDADAWAAEIDKVIKSAVIRSSYKSLGWTSLGDWPLISGPYLGMPIMLSRYPLDEALHYSPKLLVMTTIFCSALTTLVDIASSLAAPDGSVKVRFASIGGIDVGRIALVEPLNNRKKYCVVVPFEEESD